MVLTKDELIASLQHEVRVVAGARRSFFQSALDDSRSFPFGLIDL